MIEHETFEVAGTKFIPVLEDGDFELNPAATLTLPSALVCALSSASYNFSEQKQAILDALSPFQFVSKVWSIGALAQMLELDPDITDIVFVGSWFGQQSAMACRMVTNLNDYQVVLVDKDPEAHRVAQYLLKCDSYHRRAAPTLLNKDIFEMQFDSGALFVWSGLEHFDDNDVEKFLEKHSACSFIFQSTDMENDQHGNKAYEVDDILESVPAGWDSGVIYRGEIECEDLGHRYMMCLRGPGVVVDEPGTDFDDINDGLDGPNR